MLLQPQFYKMDVFLIHLLQVLFLMPLIYSFQIKIYFFLPNGKSDAGVIGAKGRGKASNIIELLSSGDSSGKKVLQALELAKFNIKDGDAIRIFEEGSRAGDSADFSSSSDGLLIVSAPGNDMNPEGGNFPTELIVYITRADPGDKKEKLEPPDPLADPIKDLNILVNLLFHHLYRLRHIIEENTHIHT